MIVETAAREAIAGLGLIRLSALQTFTTLLASRDFKSAQEISRQYLACGEQLTRDEKLALGLGTTAHFSRAALLDLAPAGFVHAARAHELTLTRAIATLRRQRLVAELDADAVGGSALPGLRHVAAHDACRICSGLHGVVTDHLDAWIFPPDGCECDGAFGLEPQVMPQQMRMPPSRTV